MGSSVARSSRGHLHHRAFPLSPFPHPSESAEPHLPSSSISSLPSSSSSSSAALPATSANSSEHPSTSPSPPSSSALPPFAPAAKVTMAAALMPQLAATFVEQRAGAFDLAQFGGVTSHSPRGGRGGTAAYYSSPRRQQLTPQKNAADSKFSPSPKRRTPRRAEQHGVDDVHSWTDQTLAANFTVRISPPFCLASR